MKKTIIMMLAAVLVVAVLTGIAFWFGGKEEVKVEEPIVNETITPSEEEITPTPEVIEPPVIEDDVKPEPKPEHEKPEPEPKPEPVKPEHEHEHPAPAPKPDKEPKPGPGPKAIEAEENVEA